MNPLLLSAGLKLLNTVVEKSGESSSIGETGWGKIRTVEEAFKTVDEARPFYARKTFWATVCAVAVPIVNRVAGLDMQIEEVSAAITPLVAFILGESWRKKS